MPSIDIPDLSIRVHEAVEDNLYEVALFRDGESFVPLSGAIGREEAIDVATKIGAAITADVVIEPQLLPVTP